MEQATSDDRRTQVFRLAKRQYAIGLLWLTAQTPEAADKEARAEANEHRADLYLVRSVEDGAQYGLGRKSEGLQSGSVSAAAALSGRLKGSVCGVFRIADGWWFFAQREDLITPQGDCFYADEQVARTRLTDAIAEGGWNHVYAPAEWGIGEILDPTEILIAAKSPRIRSLNQITAYALPAILVFVLAGGAYFGVSQYLAWQEAQDQAIAIQAAKERLERAEAERRASQVVYLPWPETPRPLAFIDDCIANMDRIQPDVPGWALSGWSCERRGKTGMTLEWSWTRMYGTPAWLEQWLSQHYPAEIAESTIFESDGDEAKTSLSGNALAARGDQSLLDERRLAIDMNAAAQGAGALLKIGKLKLPKPPEGVKAEDWVPPSFGAIGWTLEVGVVTGWSHVLDQIPGLVVESVAFDPGTSGYVLEGDVYVKR